MSINSVNIAGNLTRDMEIRQTSSGYTIGNLGIAVNERRKNRSTGEWEDEPQFFDAQILGDRAQKLAPYLVKGTKVAIQGKLHYSAWQDKQGNRRSKVDITVNDIEFMSRQGTSEGRSNQNRGSYTQNRQKPAQRPQSDSQDGYNDSDIPF